MKDEANTGRMEIKYQQIRGTGNFNTVKTEINNEYIQAMIKNIDEDVEKKDSLEILQSFAYDSFFPSIEEIENMSRQAFSQDPLLSLTGNSIVDKFGNTIAQYNTAEERETYVFWETYDFIAKLRIKFLDYYFFEAYKKNKIDYQSVLNFLENSWLNEPITRNYNGNVVEIRPIDILIPPIGFLFAELKAWSDDNTHQINTVVLNDSFTLKIEALLRYMCERMGISTFRPAREPGVVMEKNLDDILAAIKDSPENPTGFSEDDRLFLKYILSEKMGLNLRNKTAHGLMDIYEYDMKHVIIIFSIILRLVKYNLTQS